MESKTQSNAQAAMNRVLAKAAERAVTAAGFVSKPGRCQQWVREVVQSAYGAEYNQYHRESAHKSMVAWASSPFAVKPERGSVVGDILYKRGTKANPYGHVGIRVAGNRVAENSSTSRGRVAGARGFRTLKEFGEYDLIVRLPSSASK